MTVSNWPRMPDIDRLEIAVMADGITVATVEDVIALCRHVRGGPIRIYLTPPPTVLQGTRKAGVGPAALTQPEATR